MGVNRGAWQKTRHSMVRATKPKDIHHLINKYKEQYNNVNYTKSKRQRDWRSKKIYYPLYV